MEELFPYDVNEQYSEALDRIGQLEEENKLLRDQLNQDGSVEALKKFICENQEIERGIHGFNMSFTLSSSECLTTNDILALKNLFNDEGSCKEHSYNESCRRPETVIIDGEIFPTEPFGLNPLIR